MLVSTSITWIKWTENIYCIWEFSKYLGIVKASVIVYLCVCKCVGAKRWQCSYDIVLCAILVSFGFITHSDDVDWHGSWCIIIAFIYSYTFTFPNFQRRAYIFEWLRHLQLTTVHEERATKKRKPREKNRAPNSHCDNKTFQINEQSNTYIRQNVKLILKAQERNVTFAAVIMSITIVKVDIWWYDTRALRK